MERSLVAARLVKAARRVEGAREGGGGSSLLLVLPNVFLVRLALVVTVGVVATGVLGVVESGVHGVGATGVREVVCAKSCPSLLPGVVLVLLLVRLALVVAVGMVAP